MSELAEGEKYLVEQIRQGSQDAWAQLVERYQGRLLAFARRRDVGADDAEDLVQDTFMHFLRGVGAYRQEASLETYLFTILRRRLIDGMRRGGLAFCQAREASDDQSRAGAGMPAAAAPDLTASAYFRRDEQLERERQVLADALRELVDELKERQDFQDLKIIEMVFYAQLRNKEIARLAGVSEGHVGIAKHRALKRLRQGVGARLAAVDVSAIEEPGCADSLLTEIWEELRLSCPKRSTIGGYLLETLEKPWQDYVGFHIQQLGCRFCQANLEDLQTQRQEAPVALRQRLMQSTVGFFRVSRP